MYQYVCTLCINVSTGMYACMHAWVHLYTIVPFKYLKIDKNLSGRLEYIKV